MTEPRSDGPPPPADGPNREPEHRPLTVRGWAMVLAVAALGLNGMAVSAGSTDGGRGWAFAAPCVCANDLAAFVCAAAAAWCALISLSRRGGRDGVAWIALALAAGAVWAGVVIAQRTAAHVAAV